MTIKTDELRTTLLSKVISPAQLASEYPLTQDAADYLVAQRREVEAIIAGDDQRLLVIIGPCSIHDTKAALEYAERLAVLHHQLKDDLCILMRVYFEKPRTIVGWKGLISDPDLDGSFSPNKGLRIARQLLQQITELKLPIATEFLDMVNGQYIADLITWGAIGARTTESQIHREMASALSCPVGFKNGTDGNINIAVDAVRAAQAPHIFYSPDKDGAMAVYRTHGNPFGHIILRGGKTPNYCAEDIEVARAQLEQVGVTPRMIVDFSHGNSEKQHQNQLKVADSIMAQLRNGSTAIAGIMAEKLLRDLAQASKERKALLAK
jgi:3-deoxy-7-phosphoheptulonate synthase